MPFLPVGGQAVIEGVMMRSPSRVAVAVRRGDGTIAVMERPFQSLTAKHQLLGLPVVRGALSLFEALYLGISALNWSADESSRASAPAAAANSERGGAADAAANSERGGAADAAANSERGSAAASALQGLTLVLSLALGLFLFVVLPARLTGWLGFHDRVRFGLVDGGFRLLFFMLYLVLISQWREMARVLGYHGAEHKAIHALEARAPLNPKSVQSFSRLHPRCGTSFLFLVVLVSIVLFTLLGRPTNLVQHLTRIACMPLIAGIAFEFIRLSGRFADQPLVRVLVWPGLQFQRLTTREPDDSMCEVAIAALECVRVDETVIRLEREESKPAALAFIQ
ncbi:MAG: DUF1385 domain-containing protein [Candidatus Eiseniibacteriota bacterium]